MSAFASRRARLSVWPVWQGLAPRRCWLRLPGCPISAGPHHPAKWRGPANAFPAGHRSGRGLCLGRPAQAGADAGQADLGKHRAGPVSRDWRGTASSCQRTGCGGARQSLPAASGSRRKASMPWRVRCRAAISKRWCWPNGWISPRTCCCWTIPRAAWMSARAKRSTSFCARSAAAGAVVLYLSTDLEELVAGCDRVLVFYRGGICAELSRCGVDRAEPVQDHEHR